MSSLAGWGPTHLPVLEIGFLGPPIVRFNEQEVPLAARKSAALLFYLAAHPARPLTRAQLVTLLWEEHGDAEGRNNLSTALSRLRHAFLPLPVFPISSVGDSLVWQPSPEIQTDLELFAELTANSPTSLSSRASSPSGARHDENAVALYRGQFLEGFEVRDSADYEEWLRHERNRWQQRVLAVYRDLIDHEERQDQLDAAIVHAKQVLAIDPLQEQLHQSLMRLYYQGGDRAGALVQFQACERLLQKGLDVSPSAETRALREAIVAGRLPRSPARPRTSRAGPAAGPSDPATARRGRYRLVGRQTELQELRRHVVTTPGGRSRLALIQGEAGIGKTRLVEELLSWLDLAARESASSLRWTVLLGHSYPDAQGLPYHPIIEALRGQLSVLAVDNLPIADVWLAEVNRLLPEIGAQRPHLPAPPRLDPPQERRRLYEGVAQFFAVLGQPRLVILEDLHWADGETLHLLAYLVRHERLRDTLFLATLRTSDVTDAVEQILTSLEYEGRLDRLPLGPLSERATIELIREIATDAVMAFPEHSYRESEGNPLFAIELTRAQFEAGRRQTSPVSGRDAGTALPATVQAVIRARLGRLDPSSREFLNGAAIFRHAFDFEEVRTIAGQTDEVALIALEQLLQVQVLREATTPVAASLTATDYTFSHEQIRRVVHDGLSDARRRLLHRRVVELLERTDGGHHAEQLAYHSSRGQSWATALRWSEQAAADALQLCAAESAVHLYEQALACASQLPPSPELRARSIDLRLRLAQAAFYVQPGRLMEWLAPAEDDARQLGDTTRLAQVGLAQASALYILGQFTEALPRLERLQILAESTSDLALRARIDNVLGRLLVIRGELARGLVALERALAAAESGPAGPGPIWPATPLERLVSLGLAASARAFQGNFDAAANTMAQSQLIPTAPNDATARAASSFYNALIVQTRGDWTATIARANAAIADARIAANLIYEYVSHVYLGLALARQGQVAEGLRVQQTALTLAERAQTQVILGRAHAWLAEILLLDRQDQAAYDAARHGQALSEERGYLLEAAMCTRVRGECCIALGAWDEAEKAIEQAQGSLATLEAWPEWARAEAALGRLHQAQGHASTASTRFQAAARRFAEMGMAWDLAQTHLALAAYS